MFLIAVLVSLPFLGTLAYSVYLLFWFKGYQKRFDSVFCDLDTYPGISVLTSVKGFLPQMEEGLSSLLKQDYPGPLEVIVLSEEEDDPGIQQARDIVKRYSSRASVKFITGFRSEGGNPRNAKMAYGYQFASHPWIYWDAVDTEFGASHLRRMMALVQAKSENFATTMPVQYGPKDFGAIIDSISTNWESFYFLGTNFRGDGKVYGGSILFSRELLERAGGLAPILDDITEELPLRDGFRCAGGKCFLAPDLGRIRQEERSFSGFLRRKVRLIILLRIHFPWTYYSSPVTAFGGPVWTIAGLVTGQLSLLLLGLGIFAAHTVAALFYQVMLGTPRSDWVKVWVMCIYGWLTPVIWVLALTTREVNWAGDVIRIKGDGTLERVH